jgi:hypothetical protein
MLSSLRFIMFVGAFMTFARSCLFDTLSYFEAFRGATNPF